MKWTFARSSSGAVLGFFTNRKEIFMSKSMSTVLFGVLLSAASCRGPMDPSVVRASADTSAISSGTILRYNDRGTSSQGGFNVHVAVQSDGTVKFDDPKMDFKLKNELLQEILVNAASLDGNLKSKQDKSAGSTAASQELETFQVRNGKGSDVIFATVSHDMVDASTENMTIKKDVDGLGILTTKHADRLLQIVSQILNAQVTVGDLEGRTDAQALCRSACDMHEDANQCKIKLGCSESVNVPNR
jgi:hypothetical protein